MTARERAARSRRGRQPGPPSAETQAAGAQRSATPSRDRRNIGPASPAYVIEVWVSDQLRPKYGRTRLSLWQALEIGSKPAPGAEPRPDPEPEAEP